MEATKVVGIGASAGGLEALQVMFQGVPLTAGVAYVVVQHLSPDFPSMMDELLGRITELPVMMVEHGMSIKPNVVYVNAPGKEVAIQNGAFALTDRERPSVLTMPIDHFFHSLAEAFGSRTVAVVLSGTGSDGSRGIRAVHDAGGFCIVQDPDTAKFDGMPRAAIATGIIDEIVSPSAIGPLLGGLIGEIAPGSEIDVETDEDESVLLSIYRMLFESFGIDFSQYKLSTVARRITRRLALVQAKSPEAYLEFLRSDEEELGKLYKDLLIGVTAFFRDKGAFEVLEFSVIPGLIEGLAPDAELRVWSVGCATGEEPYSIAILLREALNGRKMTNRVRIFATDIHPTSISFAMAGLYSGESIAPLSAERRDRYFSPAGDLYRVSTEIRSMVTFVNHNLLRDPPFTKIDLVVCRNLLIYFQPSAQRRALSIFHFSLKAQGVLFLGSSESTGALKEDFEPLDSASKIFRKRRDRSVVPTLSHISDSTQLRLRQPDRIHATSLPEHRMLSILDSVISEYMPSGFLINDVRELLYCFGKGGDILSLRSGKASVDILELVPAELRSLLVGALPHIRKTGNSVRFERVMLTLPSGATQEFHITVRPLVVKFIKAECVLVLTEPIVSPTIEVTSVEREQVVDGRAFVHDDGGQHQIDNLQEELRYTRDTLQATIEELETTNEELQASNEELIASNEELQSTNEELHSLNEELYTVNTEYHQKISELTELSNDMENFLGATDIATLFLDSSLSIRRFTPAIGELLSLLPQDIGRRIDTFAMRFRGPALVPTLETVLREGKPLEHEYQDITARTFLVRVLPYLVGDIVDGVIVTMVDISTVKEKERALRVSEARYRTLVEASEAAVWSMDRSGAIVEHQPHWAAFVGQEWTTEKGFGWLSAVAEADRTRILELLSRESSDIPGGGLSAVVRVWSAQHQEHRVCSFRFVPFKDEVSGDEGWMATLMDAHELHRAQALLGESDVVRNILDASPTVVTVQDLLGRYILVNRKFQELLGLSAAQIEGKTDYELFPFDVAEAFRSHHVEVIHSDQIREFEEVLPVGTDGASLVRTFIAARYPVKSPDKGIYAVATIATDITERKQEELEALEGIRRRDTFMATIAHEIRNPLHAIVSALAVVQGDRGESEASERAIGVITRQSQQMTRLVDDLMGMSRANNDKMRLYRKTIDIRPTVESAIDQVKLDIEAKKQQLFCEMPEEPIWVSGDEDRLRQLVANVIDNASKYSSDAGRIWVRVEQRHENVALVVRDEGRGIAPDCLGKIFEKYAQIDGDKPNRSQGVGLGLWVVQEIARQHGGSVIVHSEGLGRGSEFVVTIPSVQSQSLEDGASIDRVKPVSGDRILLVEDNPDSSEMLKMVLQSRGYEVDVACSGKEALDRVHHQCPIAAIVDIGLPDMTGIEVVQQLRNESPTKLPLLIAVSGYGEDDDKRAAREAGFDAYLTKPVRVDDVVALLG